ncbi:MAG TPA: DUF5131 family protein [Pseudonocardiaceae bacterium]
MADRSPIEWTESTWNPTTGCDRVSAGCDNCYALVLAGRLKNMGSTKYQRDGDPRTSGPGFGVTLHPAASAWPGSASAPPGSPSPDRRRPCTPQPPAMRRRSRAPDPRCPGPARSAPATSHRRGSGSRDRSSCSRPR